AGPPGRNPGEGQVPSWIRSTSPPYDGRPPCPPCPPRQEPHVSESRTITVSAVGAGESTKRTVSAGSRAWELFADDRAVIAARVDGDLKDLSYELDEGVQVEPVPIDSPDGRDILRHSTAHVMAQAVQQLFPEAKLGIGPPVE